MKYHFSSEEGQGDGCQRVILPKCGDSEVLILNDFGHPVCFCDNERNFYPLLPSLRASMDETELRRCYRVTEDPPEDCDLNEQTLGYIQLEDKSIFLTCVNIETNLSFTFTGGILSLPCKDGSVFRFKRCISKHQQNG